MNLEEWILTEELCTRYRVEKNFIEALSSSEIIHLRTIESRQYLPLEEVGEFEKMRRLHYEMDINVEGLEAINSLLRNIKRLQVQNLELRNRLKRWE